MILVSKLKKAHPIFQKDCKIDGKEAYDKWMNDKEDGSLLNQLVNSNKWEIINVLEEEFSGKETAKPLLKERLADLLQAGFTGFMEAIEAVRLSVGPERDYFFFVARILRPYIKGELWKFYRRSVNGAGISLDIRFLSDNMRLAKKIEKKAFRIFTQEKTAAEAVKKYLDSLLWSHAITEDEYQKIVAFYQKTRGYSPLYFQWEGGTSLDNTSDEWTYDKTCAWVHGNESLTKTAMEEEFKRLAPLVRALLLRRLKKNEDIEFYISIFEARTVMGYSFEELGEMFGLDRKRANRLVQKIKEWLIEDMILKKCPPKELPLDVREKIGKIEMGMDILKRKYVEGSGNTAIARTLGLTSKKVELIVGKIKRMLITCLHGEVRISSHKGISGIIKKAGILF